MDINAKKLIRLLNQPGITAELLDAAFEKEGRDIGTVTAEAILAERARVSTFVTVDDLRRIKGVGPARLNLMLDAAGAGELDALLADMPTTLDPLPGAMRALGEALISDGCTPAPARLDAAARALAMRAGTNPRLSVLADELRQAAADHRLGLTPALPSTMAFSKIPVIQLVRQFPRHLRPELRAFNGQLEAAKNALTLFAGAVSLGNAGPAQAFEMGMRLRGDVNFARQLSFSASRACYIADTALTTAGMAYSSSANLFEGLFGIFVSLLDICSDDCIKSTVQNCTATEIAFVPKGVDQDDADRYGEALKFVDVIGQGTAGKFLTSGGNTQIKKTAGALKTIQDAEAKKIIALDGYSVFVQISYQCCKSGLCGTYWNDETMVVEINPPSANKRQRSGRNSGWKRSLIEGLGNDAKKTAVQLKEFQSLAQKLCPDGC